MTKATKKKPSDVALVRFKHLMEFRVLCLSYARRNDVENLKLSNFCKKTEG